MTNRAKNKIMPARLKNTGTWGVNTQERNDKLTQYLQFILPQTLETCSYKQKMFLVGLPVLVF